MQNKQKEFEDILKLNLLDEAKRLQKSTRGFYNQVAIYYILALIAIAMIWYVDAFDKAPLITSCLVWLFVMVFVGVDWWRWGILNYKKNSLIEIIKLYDERISFYQGAIGDLGKFVDESSKEASWLGRELSRMRTILQKAREERSQVVEIYKELI